MWRVFRQANTWLLLLCAAGAGAQAPSAPGPQNPPPKGAPPQPKAAPKRAGVGQVTVEVLGLHSDRGRVLAALYRGKEGFPTKAERAFAGQMATIKNRQAQLVFDNVPPGEFAVSTFHDENSNNTLDTGAFGIPREGWAMSRDAKASFGPPDYDDARLSLAAGERKRIVVHLQY
ncbi:MAG: DUF2141 domain-containing protein [Polyangiales bacterium]